MEFNSTEELIKDIKSGKMVILLDDEDRENEGDLVCAADCVTCLLYTSPSPRDLSTSRMPSSA